MEFIEQTSYNEGATENCKDLITKTNRILSDLGEEKVLKMRRGIEQDFVEVIHEGKRVSEDWDGTKEIYSETFYEMINKYLFDKLDSNNAYYVNQVEFVQKTMKTDQANIKQTIYFLVNNYLLKEYGLVPDIEVPRVEGHPSKKTKKQSTRSSNDKIVNVEIDGDGNSIVTFASGKKEYVVKSKAEPFLISNNPTPAVEFPFVENVIEQNPVIGEMHNHAPNPTLHGNEAIVAAHQGDTIQNSNFQKPIDMLKRTAEQVAPTVQAVPTEKKMLTTGEHFLGVTLTPHENENVNEVLASLSEIAEFLIDLEQEDEAKNNATLKNLHAHAKMSLLTASMAITRVITQKR